MGDLEEAEAGKGCREEKIHMDKIDFANESLRLQKVDEFSEILRTALDPLLTPHSGPIWPFWPFSSLAHISADF